MFHVYVEGPTGTGAAAARALADAMASRYGLSAQDLIARFARGRIRVKANVDRRTAETYARDLEAIGARVKLEEARPTDSSAIRRDEIALPTPPTGTRVSPATTPPAGERSPGSPEIARETPFARAPNPQRRFGPSTPPSGTRRPSTPPLGTDPGTRGRASSGLPRAASPTAGSRFPSESRTPSPQRVNESRTPSPQRGTPPTTPPLGTDPGVPTPNPPMRTSPAIVVRPSSPALPARPLSAPLPVVEPARPQSNSLPPSPAAKPVAPSGLAAAYSATNQPADLGALDELTLSSLDGKDAPDVTIRPATAEFRPPPGVAAPAPAPLDLFAPPGADDDKAPLDLMAEDKPKPKPMSIPLAAMPAAPGVMSTPVLRPKLATPPAGIAVATPKPRLGVQVLAQPRVRLAAGVVLAIVLGFVPAHIVASLRESSAFKAIDAEVTTTQAQATTPEAFAALDSYRHAELDAKYSKRRSIALTSMLIWALASGGLAYVWFRRVPWYRLT